MAFKNNYVDLINQRLIKCSADFNIEPFTLSTPEHQFKKRTGVFNQAIREVYDERNSCEDIKLFHILLALHQYFELDWLMENILEDDIKSQVRDEMIEEYNAVPDREYIPTVHKKTSLTVINEAEFSIAEKAAAYDKMVKECKKEGVEIPSTVKPYPFKPFTPFNIGTITENQIKSQRLVFNKALMQCCVDDEDTDMHELLVGIQEYFDPAWILHQVLDDANRDYLIEEMDSSYGVDVMKIWDQY